MGNNEIKGFMDSEWSKPWTTEHTRKSKMKKARSRLVVELGRTPLPTEYGNWTYLVFGDYSSGKEHDLLVFGEMKFKKLRNENDIMLRMHSACRSAELFHATNCECREELEKAMRTIAREGHGIILYLNQEGAGNGSAAKLAAYNRIFEWNAGRIGQARDRKTRKLISIYDAYEALGYKPERRDFETAGEILKSIGVKSVRLLTNNPHKIRGLEESGIRVQSVGIHIAPKNRIMANTLSAKARQMGHKISKKHTRIRRSRR